MRLALLSGIFLLFAGAAAAHAQTATSPGTVTLTNAQWDTLQVEVRIGPSQNCDDNASQGVRVLWRDATWLIRSVQVVCWRREETPGAAAPTWGAWERAQLTTDQVRTVTF